MKKGLIVLLALVVIGSVAYFGGAALKNSGNSDDQIVASQAENVPASQGENVSATQAGGSNTSGGQPSRAAEIRGTVKAIEGDKLVVARAKDDPMANMTEEQLAARREQMLKLSFEERQAKRQQELQGLQTEDVNVTIPVGVSILKAMSGASQPGDGEESSLENIRVGSSLVIWTEGGKTDNAVAEFVRIAAGQ